MGKLPNVVPAGLQSLQSIPRQMNMTLTPSSFRG